ncbi:uncharacterized protein C7orf50 homolog [Pelobates fuscus]|uniref:uncharacterized protein C7orf50 homolog n=1 Tax=Pelobates fuscus TaxID=191477 RepID=UPI002FE4E195
MARNKNRTEVKNYKKKKLTVSTSEESPAKKKKMSPKDPEDPDDALSKVESPEMKDLEDLTPEEQRKRERKLKKERKKEEKRLKRESAIDDDDEEEKPSKPSVCELSLQYLKSWSEKRKDWKFQKTRQIWLLQNMYDQEKISDDYFPILLEYLEGLKGSARDTTVKQAEDLMKEYDKSEAKAEADVQKMSRIREVLQLLS